MIGPRVRSVLLRGVQSKRLPEDAPPVRAEWRGTVLAESSEVRAASGYLYFPPHSVRWEHLTPSDHHTTCPWKGLADYYHVEVDGGRNANAAFSYPNPLPKAEDLAGWVAFWGGVKIRRG
jgi:uncharacterized protein (DUF427 family)